MDFETIFEATLTETVALREPTGTDMYGGPTYVSAVTVTVPAWISRRPREIRTLTGEQRIATARVSLGHPSTGVAVPMPTPECEITLPDGSKPAILSVASILDPDGDRHVEVFV